MVALLALLSGCRNSLINSFAFYPEPMARTAQAPTSAEEIWLTTSDGLQLQALWFAVPTSQTAVLFLHGNAGHLYYRTDDARALAATGSSVLLLSYRGYGKSEGSPSEQGLYRDAQAALEHLHQRGYSDKTLFVLGRSIGAAVAIDLAQGRRLAGLILVTPFSSGNDMAREIGLGWLTWALASPFDSIGKLSRVDSPALFIHGDRDNIVPLRLGQKLYEAYPGQPKQMIVVPGANHNDLTGVAGSAYWQWIAEFIRSQTPHL